MRSDAMPDEILAVFRPAMQRQCVSNKRLDWNQMSILQLAKQKIFAERNQDFERILETRFKSWEIFFFFFFRFHLFLYVFLKKSFLKLVVLMHSCRHSLRRELWRSSSASGQWPACSHARMPAAKLKASGCKGPQTATFLREITFTLFPFWSRWKKCHWPRPKWQNNTHTSRYRHYVKKYTDTCHPSGFPLPCSPAPIARLWSQWSAKAQWLHAEKQRIDRKECVQWG